MHRRIMVMLLTVLPMVMLSALNPKDICFSVGADAFGTDSDTAGAVCVQLDIGAKADFGFFLSDDWGVIVSAGAVVRTAVKQYSRFAEVPATRRFTLGAGLLFRFDEPLLLSVDTGLSANLVGQSWNMGVYINAVPRFIVADLSGIRYSVGIPVSVMYSGDISLLGIGVCARMEVYE